MSPPTPLEALAPFFGFFAPQDVPEGPPAWFAFCLPVQATLERWPEFPRAALPDTGRAAAGKGVTPAACRLSALGEAVELASACAWGDEPLETTSIAALGPEAVEPAAVLGHSPDQIAARDEWNQGPWGELDWRPAPYGPDTPLEWVEAQDALTGAPRRAPADLVLIGRRERGDDAAAAVANTAGCAAGASSEAALTSAVCELIERDAAGRWWHGRRGGRPVDPEALGQAVDLKTYLQERDRRTKLFDLGAEFGPTSIVALSFDAEGRRLAMGFSCRHEREAAAISAALELLQTEVGIAQREAIDDPLTLRWLATAHVGLAPEPAAALAEPAALRTVAETDRLEAMLVALQEAGHPVSVVDLTRKAFGVPVVRALAPGLCSDRPRFGMRRMPGRPGAPPNPEPLAV